MYLSSTYIKCISEITLLQHENVNVYMPAGISKDTVRRICNPKHLSVYKNYHEKNSEYRINNPILQ